MKKDCRKTWLLACLFVLVVATALSYGLIFGKKTYTYSMSSTAFSNPLMGWAPWATIQKSEQAHSLVYADLTWRELEPEQGNFAFADFEKENQFERWRAEGVRVVFRFVTDVPGDEVHMDIPDWLYEKIEGDGDFYDHEYGKGFSPNYNNPTLIAYHQKAIQALGKRYAQDDLIAFIELGSLGHWGEWHIKRETNIRSLPLEEIRDQYVQHYLDAFPNTHILMRRPFSIAEEAGLGLYNDMSGNREATETWLDWIENGGVYTQTGEDRALKPMPYQWQVAPIGGELSPSTSMDNYFSENLEQSLDLFQRSHTTFVGPNSPYMIQYGGELQPGIDAIVSTIGYRIYVQKMRAPAIHCFGNWLPVDLILANSGIAPFYYAWEMHIHILDESGQSIRSYPLDIDIRDILPGELVETSIRIPVEDLEKGTYTIGIAIHDPTSGQPAVRFAMQNERTDRIQILQKFMLNQFLNH